jgi:hypothetical protein
MKHAKVKSVSIHDEYNGEFQISPDYKTFKIRNQGEKVDVLFTLESSISQINMIITIHNITTILDNGTSLVHDMNDLYYYGNNSLMNASPYSPVTLSFDYDYDTSNITTLESNTSLLHFEHLKPYPSVIDSIDYVINVHSGGYTINVANILYVNSIFNDTKWNIVASISTIYTTLNYNQFYLGDDYPYSNTIDVHSGVSHTNDTHSINLYFKPSSWLNSPTYVIVKTIDFDYEPDNNADVLLAFSNITVSYYDEKITTDISIVYQ